MILTSTAAAMITVLVSVASAVKVAVIVNNTATDTAIIKCMDQIQPQSSVWIRYSHNQVHGLAVIKCMDRP